jgi:hypothetical protein
MAVKVTDNIMYSISPDTAISTLVNTVTKNKGEAEVTDANGNVKATGSYVTGDKITIIGTNERVTYTIAVRGDINGDASINSVDLLAIRRHLLTISTLKNEYFTASDVNYDNVINSSDLLRVRHHLLGISFIK